jgi:hypothetical protein
VQLVYAPNNPLYRVAFPANAAKVVPRVEVSAASASGRPLRHRLSITCEEGFLDGDGQREIAAIQAAVVASLRVPYQDLAFYCDDGSLAFGLFNTDPTNLSGVTVTDGPHFDEALGPEFVTLRTVRFTASAEYVATGAAAALVSWQQTVSVRGTGGPRKVWRFPLNAAAVRQRVTPQTLTTVVQSGTAVGHLVKPAPPALILPRDYLVEESYGLDEGVGRPVGPSRWVEIPVKWSYTFNCVGIPSYSVALPVV